MTDNNSQSQDNVYDEGPIQLGAKVDSTLAALLKGLVRHKHNKIRGALGSSYELALEYYLGVHVIQHPEAVPEIIEIAEIEDNERASNRLHQAIDNVGPDLFEVIEIFKEQSIPEHRFQHLSGKERGASGYDSSLGNNQERSIGMDIRKGKAVSPHENVLQKLAWQQLSVRQEIVSCLRKLDGRIEDQKEKRLNKLHEIMSNREEFAQDGVLGENQSSKDVTLAESKSNLDSEEREETQLGARVDRVLASLVKGLVRHKHGKVRGPLGRSYERSIEYYLSIHIIQHPEDAPQIIETAEVEDDLQASRGLLKAADNAGPDLVDMARAHVQRDSPDANPSSQHKRTARFDEYSTTMPVEQGDSDPDQGRTSEHLHDIQENNRDHSARADTLKSILAEQNIEEDHVVKMLIEEGAGNELFAEKAADKILENDEIVEKLIEKIIEDVCFDQLLSRQSTEMCCVE